MKYHFYMTILHYLTVTKFSVNALNALTANALKNLFDSSCQFFKKLVNKDVVE